MNTNDDQDRAGAQHRRLLQQERQGERSLQPESRFSEGYRVGMLTFGKLTSGQLLETEKALRQETEDCLNEGFTELKRGMWAARVQMVAAKMRRLPRTSRA
jgi:hypothetical protein